MASYSAICGVTFDVGGTLISPWPSVGHVYSAVARRHGYAKIPPAVLTERFAAAWKNKQDFSHTRQHWRKLVNETFAGLLPALPSDEFFADLYAAFGKTDAWRLFDDVHPTLQKLRELGLRLGIVSNWDERLRPLLLELELSPYFAACAISIEVGVAKPSAAIFEAAAKALKLPPASLLHVGDTPSEDTEGARPAGWSALLLDRQAAMPGDGVIRSLTEIADILAKQL